MVRPEFGQQLELELIQIAQGGRVPLPITDEQLKKLLIQLEGQQKKRDISIRRV
jgi:programmed cell death protein 5